MSRRSWQYWVSLVGSLAVCIEIGHVLIGHPPLDNLIGLLVGVLVHTLISLHLVRPYIRTLLSAEQA
jgi:divalent metal cation (Fe/Co/Zn/Cd) transporter